MKQTIKDHEKNIKEIKKIIEFDRKWMAERIEKRQVELEFYQRQVIQAKARNLKHFDREKFLK